MPLDFIQAKEQLTLIGIEITRNKGKYRVNIPCGGDATSFTTDCLIDAYLTGEAMAVINRSYTFSIPTR